MSAPAVTPFQGPRPAPARTGALPRDPAASRRAPRPPEQPLLPATAARVAALLALVAFGAAHWMQMVEPAAGGRALAAVALAGLTAGALLPAGRIGATAPRAAVLAGTTVAVLALALLAGGVRGEDLEPRNWGALASTISAGLDALPGARIPYRGLDEALRLVVPLGGTVLAVVAALLACWPRRGRTGFTVPALIALVTLYAVPAVALILDAEFVRGALLALLVVAFLRLGRLRRRDAPAAGAVLAAAAVCALVIAPAMDGLDPWWDYEDWAQTAAGARSTQFDWDHDYSALGWPRDGRELLRIESRQRAYWKADQLDVFDGRGWTRDVGFNADDEAVLFSGIDVRRLMRWSFSLKVTVRNLRSGTLPLAGSAEEVSMPGRRTLQVRPGIWAVGRQVRRGDAYEAEVYVPQPSAGDLQGAGTAYSSALERYTQVVAVPEEGLYADTPLRMVARGFFGVEPTLIDPTGGRAVDVIASSDLARTYRLSRRLLSRSSTPYEYVKAVERHLGDDRFTYSETPPLRSRTLDGFLFGSRIGFCQQYSGAMALLLRMGGVPARVATGFSPGSFDRRKREYVVRDVDAHSWVEAFFPGIGWVTFDPTPAAAPPRSQAAATAPSAGRGDAADLGTTTADPSAPVPAPEDPRPWGLYAVAVVLLAAAALGARRAWALRHRPHRPAVSELERALRGAGEPVPPGVTLRELEARFAASPPAASYLAALRAARYSPAGGGPTAAQRRGLRRALARGRGPLARVRTWLALPPRPPWRHLS